MNSHDRSETDDAIFDEAIAWLVRVESEDATDRDRAELAQWLASSDSHRDAFDAVELLSGDIAGSAGDILAALPPRPAKVVEFRPRAFRPHRWLAPVAVAAAVAGAVVIGAAAWRAYEGVPTDYRAAPGQTRLVLLADGTRIRLDSASTMRVQLGWRTRRVELGEAEAAFDVAKDPTRPFVIDVGDQQVRVVGTEFNIRHYDGTVVITVRRGVVEVRQPDMGPQPIARLTKGEELRHSEGTPQSSVAGVDADAAFAWTDGRLVCDNQPLSEIVAYLNRRYLVPIRLSDAAAKRRFSGVLELGDETTLVRHLAGYLSLTVTREDRDFSLR